MKTTIFSFFKGLSKTLILASIAASLLSGCGSSTNNKVGAAGGVGGSNGNPYINTGGGGGGGPIINTGGGSSGFPIVDQVKSMIACNSSSQYGSARIDLAYSSTSAINSTSLSGQLTPGGINGTPGNHYVGRNYAGDLLFAVQMTQGSGSTVSYAIILSLCPSPLFQPTSSYQQFGANGITIAANPGYQVGNLGSQTQIVVTPPNSSARQIPLIFAPL
ncbi:MAG: hypothetical protein WCG27_07065 [Pseudomonadota bacterium]